MKFPDSTYFNRKLPKQRFYENLTVSAATKKSFVDQIKSIYWENKISADTINIAAENTVTEIEIFRINLNQDTIDESVLRLLDKGIPYPIIFILQYNGKSKLCVAYKEMCGIIESSQKAAHQAVNTLLVQRNWMIGYRIAEEEFGGQERSEYGLHVIKKLSKELTNRYGKGYDRGTLYRCLKFYKLFPEIVASLRQQSGAILSWTHYRILLQVEDKEARDWYARLYCWSF